jgi:16S rRNA (uracil1498-N3)-methyltransferase
MSRPHFLVSRATPEGASIDLELGEAKHARVRRVRRGEEVIVLDGLGWSALAEVDCVTQRSVLVRIVAARSPRHSESPLDLTLAVALLKSDRFDWLVEKATELGVTRIRPLTSRYSLGRPAAGRRERWRQIALAAAKQCGRTVPPDVHPPAAFEAVLRELAGTKVLFAEASAPTGLPTEQAATGRISILIGPEGGFTPEELKEAESAGCHLASLGPRILRAETAAIAAVTLCQYTLGDLYGLSNP